MANYKTPGVYVEEISKLPASVAPVATAIPAFIGYTEKREKNGESLAANTPVRITSLLEYREIFGGAFDENLASRDRPPHTIQLDSMQPIAFGEIERFSRLDRASAERDTGHQQNPHRPE